MKAKNKLRWIILAMFIIAVIFIFCALSNPALGRVIYIGSFKFGVDQWRVCYAIYAIIMIMLFVTSFFVKDSK